MKKIPMRKCMGCLESKPKKELCRIVKSKDGSIFIDSTGKADGRGAYICYSKECLEKAIKNKKLQREFEMDIDVEVYDELRSKIDNDR